MAILRDDVDPATFEKRCAEDFLPLLTEAVCLECGLGEQDAALGQMARTRIKELFQKPERFLEATERRAGRGGGS